MMQPTAPAVPIYRGMDRTTLDAAYNNSAAVKDSGRWLAAWHARSQAARAIDGARLDIPYGDKERNRFDYFPSGATGAPLFVFIHGGYWQRNDKETFSFVSDGPRAHGFDVAVLGYTLAPAARLSQIVAEIRQALAHLAVYPDRFGFDPRRIFVGGWSAGGHLAAVACSWPMVRGALAISGIFDLEPIALSYINEPLRLTRDEIASYSPLKHLHGGNAPQSVVVGGNELPELQRQAAAYAEAARRNNRPIALHTLPGHHHFSILDELADANGTLTAELRNLANAPQRTTE